MFKIDLHTHILPEHWPDLAEKFGGDRWVRLVHHRPCCARMMVGEDVFREVESDCWDPAVRIADCDRTQVAVQVLSTVPIMFSYWAPPEQGEYVARLLNDHLAGVVSVYPNRFVGLGTLPMQDPDRAIRELERCVGDLGFPGVQIGSNVNGKDLDSPEVVAVLEAAEALSASIFVHPWEMLGRERHQTYWLPWLVGMPAETTTAIARLMLGGVLERLPRLRIAFAHGGGTMPFTIGRLEKGWNARPDLVQTHAGASPRDLLRRIYVDSLVHDLPAFRMVLETMGADRIALGSDYPFPLGEQHPGSLIQQAGLDPCTCTRLLSGTALEFLDLERSRFTPPS